MSWQKVRFVHVLTTFVSISMLCMMIFQWFVSYFEVKQTLYTTTSLLNAESANKMAVTMSTVFRSMDNALKANAQHIAEQMESEADIQPHVDHFMESNNFFNEVIIVEKTGKVVAASDNASRLLNSVLINEVSQQSLKTREPAISNRSETESTIVMMTHPIVSKEGEYYGYLGGTIYLHRSNFLNEIFGTYADNDSGSYAYVIDQAGHLLYHPDQSRLGEDVSANAIVQKLIDGGYGCEEVINTRGKVFVAGYMTVPENGWGIVVQTPIEAIQAQALRMIFKEILYMLPIFLILLVTTILLARKLAAPFSLLAEAAERAMAGKSVDDFPNKAMFSYEANQLYKTVLLAMDKLQKQAEHYSNVAQTDALTGLANRRTFNTLITNWVKEQKPFSVIFIDIDYFKEINDTYGHQIGDQVLQFLADILLANTRKEDHCCRYGGEEFVILLPETPIETAYQITERIRSSLEQHHSPTGKPITVSCGVASFPEHAETVQDILDCADQALYSAKRQGRNRIITYGQKHHQTPVS